MALDDLDDRFATAVKLALGASRTAGNGESDADLECPSSDMIASYYEYALNRVERARLEEHFSGCARCQGTLAALLRTAPAIDIASEAGGFAAAAARGATAESAGIRERWFEIRPAWRIAGVAAVATAMLAVMVVAGVHVYQGRIGPESERLAALSPAAAPHDRHKSHPASTSSNSAVSSGAQLALNDKKSANKSPMPAAPAEPRAATAPYAAAAAPGAASTAPTNPPVEAGAPAEEVAPPIAPSNAEQNEAAPASAAQAAAALGALAATPAPAAGAAPSTSAAPSVAAAPSAAAPSVAAPAAAASVAAAATPPVATSAVESKNNAAAIAAAPAAGAVAARAAGAAIAARAAAPPASQTTARAAPPAAPGAVNETQQQLAKVSPTTPSLQQPEHAAVTQAPANALKAAPEENSRQSASVAEPAATADVAALAKKRAQQQLAKEQLAQQQFAQQQLAQDQLAEEKREAEMTRKAELARKAEQAKRDAVLKRQMERARREAQARSAMASSPTASPRPQSRTPLRMQIASAPPQSQRAVGGAGNAGSGNAIARAEPPVNSAPVVAAVAPGIPVAPHALLISPPDHSVYWSLQNSGLIYHTSDRKSWTPQSTGVQTEFLAGMAPSDTVCWAVGRKGVILLTTDGTHWERINSPTASDVIGIVAASKDVATIFTTGGVNYSTFDGGSNWEQAN